MSTAGRLRGIFSKRSAVVAAGCLVALFATTSALALTIKVHLFGSAPEAQVTVDLNVDLPVIEGLEAALAPLSYEIHTRGGSGCTTRNAPVRGRYGVATPVDLGGSALPDVAVTVVPVPAIPGVTDVTTLTMKVNKLVGGTVPGEVVAVLAPSGPTDADRVAFGYDACSTTVPRTFDTEVVSRPSQLKIDTRPADAGADLTIVGAAFQQNGTTITDPTQVAARLAPVPSQIGAVIDILPESTYEAHVTTSSEAELAFAYLDETTGAEATTVNVGVDKLPRTVGITVSPNSAAYTAAGPIGAATVDVTKTATGERTTHVSADLLRLPAAASFVQDGDDHATFTVPVGVLGEAAVRFASFEPNTTLPDPPANANQYFNATFDDDYDLADVQLFDVSHLSGGWGDDFDLDLVHRRGPFDVDVVSETQTVDALITELPEDITFGYTAALGAFAYHGSDSIDEITVDLFSAEPIGSTRADEVHVVVKDIPKHMTATLDHEEKRFAADMVDDRLGSIEILLTNGPDERIPGDVDGLLYVDPIPPAPPKGPSLPVDPNAPYQAFVRVSAVEEVNIGWGAQQSVHLIHEAQPFELSARIAELAGSVFTGLVSHGVAVEGTLTNLPHDVLFTYTPGKSFTYAADGVLDLLDITVQKSGADGLLSKLGVHAERLDDLGLTFNEPTRSVTATITGLPLGLLEVSSRDTDHPIDLLEGAVGVSKIKTIDSDGDEDNNAFVRLREISGASVAMGKSDSDDPVTVSLRHAGGPFTVKAAEDAFGPKIPLFKNTRTIDVDIPNLPAVINHLSYSGKTREVHLNAETGIDSLDAHVTNTVEPLAGDIEGPYAKSLDLHIEGIPGVLDLTPTFETAEDDDRDQKIFIDLGPGQTIGLLEILLTSGPDNRAHLVDEDGLIVDDLEDSYAIFARATGLSHLHYLTSTELTGEPSGEIAGHDVDTRLLGDEGGPHNLNLIVRKFTGDVTKPNGVEHITARYTDPPVRNHIYIQRRTKDNGDDWTTKVEYEGYDASGAPDAGGELLLNTNKGRDRTFLTTKLTPVPATAKVCLAPSDGTCDPADPPGSRDELSYRLFDLSEPVQLELTDCIESGTSSGLPPGSLGPQDRVNCQDGGSGAFAYGGRRVEASAWIERSLTALNQTDRDCEPNCQYLHIDTGDGGLSGELKKSFVGNGGTRTEMWITIPEGFRTQDRFVKIECDPPSGCTGHSSGEDWTTGRLGGKAACPDGTHIEIPIVGVDSNLAEEFCPNAKPEGFEQTSFARGTTTQTKLVGRDFSPDASVRVGRWINGNFEDVGVTVAVIGPDPDDYYDSLIVTVDVPAGVAPRDDYDLLVANPHVGTEGCDDCFTVT